MCGEKNSEKILSFRFSHVYPKKLKRIIVAKDWDAKL